MIGAKAIPISPRRRIPITVAIDAAKKLTRLFPSKIKPIKRSGLSNNFLILSGKIKPLEEKKFQFQDLKDQLSLLIPLQKSLSYMHVDHGKKVPGQLLNLMMLMTLQK